MFVLPTMRYISQFYVGVYNTRCQRIFLCIHVLEYQQKQIIHLCQQ